MTFVIEYAFHYDVLKKSIPRIKILKIYYACIINCSNFINSLKVGNLDHISNCVALKFKGELGENLSSEEKV